MRSSAVPAPVPGMLSRVEIAVPAVHPEALLSVADGLDFRFLWEPPSGGGFAAIGIAAIVRGTGSGRFAMLREGARELFAEADPAVTEGLRLVGGLAFAPGSADSPAWQGFGDGTFVLPRWTYSSDPTPRLVGVGESLDELQHEGRVLASRLEAGAAKVGGQSPRAVLVTTPDPASWRSRVEEALEAIRSGRLSKVVVADAASVELADDSDGLTLLSALRRPGRTSTRFACGFGPRLFLGASPELLVRLEGLDYASEALAGSIATGAQQALALAQSHKDREEHQLVLDAIVGQLERISTRVEVASEPTVSTLAHVQHLRTPVTGTLRERRHVLELAERLHPTPAVGGVPTAAAVDWIRRHEAQPRGWYAGPLGWFDAQGNGELLVALRSGLVEGRRALVFAGAGIVKDSDPQAEYEEAELKRRTLLAPLGVRP